MTCTWIMCGVRASGLRVRHGRVVAPLTLGPAGLQEQSWEASVQGVRVHG